MQVSFRNICMQKKILKTRQNTGIFKIVHFQMKEIAIFQAGSQTSKKAISLPKIPVHTRIKYKTQCSCHILGPAAIYFPILISGYSNVFKTETSKIEIQISGNRNQAA